MPPFFSLLFELKLKWAFWAALRHFETFPYFFWGRNLVSKDSRAPIHWDLEKIAVSDPPETAELNRWVYPLVMTFTGPWWSHNRNRWAIPFLIAWWIFPWRTGNVITRWYTCHISEYCIAWHQKLPPSDSNVWLVEIPMVTTLLQLNMALKHQIKTNSFSGNIVFVRRVTRLLCPTMDCFCHTQNRPKPAGFVLTPRLAKYCFTPRLAIWCWETGGF